MPLENLIMDEFESFRNNYRGKLVGRRVGGKEFLSIDEWHKKISI